MIALRDNSPKLTPEEYFQWEEGQATRHEYLNGEVYAMSGGTQNHGRIASNIIFILKGHLRGGGCQVGNSDCRINIFETDDYVYPDVSVTSLQDYVLVDAEKIAINLYRRNTSGSWEIVNYQGGDTIQFQSIGMSCAIEAVYEDIIFEAAR